MTFCFIFRKQIPRLSSFHHPHGQASKQTELRQIGTARRSGLRLKGALPRRQMQRCLPGAACDSDHHGSCDIASVHLVGSSPRPVGSLCSGCALLQPPQPVRERTRDPVKDMVSLSVSLTLISLLKFNYYTEWSFNVGSGQTSCNENKYRLPSRSKSNSNSLGTAGPCLTAYCMCDLFHTQRKHLTLRPRQLGTVHSPHLGCLFPF